MADSTTSMPPIAGTDAKGDYWLQGGHKVYNLHIDDGGGAYLPTYVGENEYGSSFSGLAGKGGITFENSPSQSGPSMGDVAPADQGAWRQPGSQPAQPSNTLAPVGGDVSVATPTQSTPATASLDMASAWGTGSSTSPTVAASAQSGLQAAAPTAANNTSQTTWNIPESSATNMAAIEDARKRQTLAQQVPQSAMSGLSGLRY